VATSCVEHPTDPVEDDRLAAAAQQGHRQAAEELVRRYLGRAYGLALRLVGNRHDAEDAAQEAMLRAMRFLSSYRLEGTFDRWILKVASNTCLDMLRKKRNLRVHGMSAEQEAVLAAAEPDPSKALAAERLALVDKLLVRLPEQQRTVFVLFHHEKRSLRDVALILDVPEGTVRSSLHRARGKLREWILLAEEGCRR
jgi:RNA polymerase sigma-70 factor, ECF subfamily